MTKKTLFNVLAYVDMAWADQVALLKVMNGTRDDDFFKFSGHRDLLYRAIKVYRYRVGDNVAVIEDGVSHLPYLHIGDVGVVTDRHHSDLEIQFRVSLANRYKYTAVARGDDSYPSIPINYIAPTITQAVVNESLRRPWHGSTARQANERGEEVTQRLRAVWKEIEDRELGAGLLLRM